MSPTDPLGIAVLVAIGALAGFLGGLAGVGGSMVILPSLHALLGSEPGSVHHFYMAAAMTVNVAVAVPASRRHWRAGAVRRDLLTWLVTAATAGVIAGVVVSNQIDGGWLKKGLAAFIAVYCVWNLERAMVQRPEHAAEQQRTRWFYLVGCGVGMGLVAGLLGLGGGILLVPLLQFVCRVPLKQSIATSSVVVVATALVGAGTKLATLESHGYRVEQALLVAGLMAPSAMFVAPLGARLTHSLPLGAVRIAITVLLALSAAKLAGAW